MTQHNDISNCKENRELWWKNKRFSYNIGLIISGVLSYITYSIIVNHVVPFRTDDGFVIFEIFFQGIAYLFMMGIANIFYSLGPFAEKIINPKNVSKFRKRLFHFGLFFSCSLPFLIPILVLFKYY